VSTEARISNDVSFPFDPPDGQCIAPIGTGYRTTWRQPMSSRIPVFVFGDDPISQAGVIAHYAAAQRPTSSWTTQSTRLRWRSW
jgi:hypothetical protein